MIKHRPYEKKSKLWWVALIFVLALLPRIFDLNVFLAHDETRLWTWSRTFFFSLLQGDFAGTIVGPGNPSVIPMWLQTIVMGMQYGWAWLNRIPSEALVNWTVFQPDLAFADLSLQRLPFVLVNTASVTVIWGFCYKLFGRKLAFLATILLIFDPFWLSDSRTLRGEGLLAGFVTIVLLSFIIFWVARQWRYLFISGLFMGLALLTKMSAVAVLPSLFLITLVHVYRIPDLLITGRIKKAVIALLIWSAVVLTTFWALWPAMWVAPVAAIEFLWNFAHDVSLEGRTNYFFGKLYGTEFLPLYYLTVFVLKVTPVVLVGIFAFVSLFVMSLWYKFRYKQKSWLSVWGELWPDVGGNTAPSPLLLALLATFPLIFGLFMTVGALKRDWYFMPAFPTIDILAAAGLLWLGQWLWLKFFPNISSNKAWLSGAGILSILQMAFVLSSHPFYFTYWNPLVGGNWWADKALMLGVDFDLGMAAHYLNDKPDAEQLKVATRTRQGFQEIFHGSTIPLEINSEWIQSDYLLVRLSHLQLQKHDAWELRYVSKLPLEHVVNINGVNYLWIYQGPGAKYALDFPSELVGKATLFGFDMPAPTVEVGDKLHFDLYWLDQGMSVQDTFFVRLTDMGGNFWAESIAEIPLEVKKLDLDEKPAMVKGVANLKIPVGTPPGKYILQMGVYNQAMREEVGQFLLPDDGKIIDVLPGQSRLDPPPISRSLNYQVIPDITLLGFDLRGENLSLLDKNQLDIYWQAKAPPKQDLAISLQLLDQDKNEVTYWLGRPVRSSYPTNQWHVDEIVKDPWELKIPSHVPPGHYTLRLTLYDSIVDEMLGSVDLAQTMVVDRRRLFDKPSLQYPVEAQLDDSIMLLGYDLFQQPLTNGVQFKLKLYWQSINPVLDNYTVFTQILNPDGLVAGQHDSIPANGQLPTTSWQPGEIIVDEHLIKFPVNHSGSYRLIVGMYNPITGERLLVTDATGESPGDFLDIYQFDIE